MNRSCRQPALVWVVLSGTDIIVLSLITILWWGPSVGGLLASRVLRISATVLGEQASNGGVWSRDVTKQVRRIRGTLFA